MASKSSKNRQANNLDSKNLLSIQGYIANFDTCENAAAVFSRLAPLIGEDLNDDIWLQELNRHNCRKEAKHLFDFWNDICDKKCRMSKDDFIRYIQIFLLLENVFRNIILRPYVPAYRFINKHSGPFQCFVQKSDIKLFENLQFNEYSSDLLIYENSDISQTIIYAITCNIFWHVLKMDFSKYHSTN